MPETMESTESYAGYVSSYVSIPVMKFILEIRHSKIWTAASSKIGQLQQ